MSLQYKFFIIPVKQIQDAENDLNLFLKTIRVITIHRDFVPQGENSFWSIAVEYLSDGVQEGKVRGDESGRKKADYREILSPEEFSAFVKLREWRKTIAEKEGVPVYTIFTNEQLANIIRRKITGKSGLGEIDGVGEARVRKYGDAISGLMEKILEKPDAPQEKGSVNETKERSLFSDSNV